MTNSWRESFELAGLKRLLSLEPEDSFTAEQLRDRIKAIQEESREDGKLFPLPYRSLPETAVFFKSEEIDSLGGVDPKLAADAMLTLARMFEYRANAQERLAREATGKKRRLRGSPLPRLLFTHTIAGSVGLAFTPRTPTNDPPNPAHALALADVADAIEQVANSTSETFESVIEGVDKRLLEPLRVLFESAAKFNSSLRVASKDRSSPVIPHHKIKAASERLSLEVSEESISVQGKFGGLTSESGHFDHTATDGRLYKGYLSESLSQEDVDRMEKFYHQDCVAKILRVTVTLSNGSRRHEDTLMDIQPLEQEVEPSDLKQENDP